MQLCISNRLRWAGFILGALPALRALANHGPGASGGGSQTISGETLKQGRFELSLRQDFSQFEHFDQTQAAARARQGGDFDALDHGFITTVGASYGLTDDFQVDAAIGYFAGRDFLSATLTDANDVEFANANPKGLTDLSLTAKYRILKGAPGNLAVICGVVLPTGKDDARLSSGERISPTDQPGTGRYGLPAGVAYSRFLTSHLTVDASALYTVHFEKDDFKVGDRFETGIALAYRLTDSIQTFPQFSIFAELNNVYLFKDRSNGQNDPNSGSNVLYLTPGFRVRFDEHAALTFAPSIPVYEHLNGDQGRVAFKLAVTLSISF